MGNMDSVFYTFVSGSEGYSSMFTAYAANVANAGVIAGKKRDGFLSTVNSIATPTNFVPAGVSYKPTIDIQTIGGVRPSSTETNMMLNTKALFIVNESTSDATPGNFGFTKVGTFYPDKDGYIVNHAGLALKVVPTNADGSYKSPNVSTFDQLTSLNVKDRVGLPQASTYCDLFASLPSTSTPPAAGTATTGTQQKLIYDAKGNTYNLKVTYTRKDSIAADPIAGTPGDPASSERWGVTVACETNTNPPVQINTITAAWVNGVDIVFKNGVPLHINPDLQNADQALPPLVITPPATTAVVPIDMDISFGTVGQSDGLTALNGTTFDMRDIGADGKGSGKFVGLTWDKNGYGTITYSNQTTEIVCRVPIVKFRSMNSLTEGSNGVFYSSEASGPYTLSFPQADIIPSALEESTASATDTYVAMARDGKRFSACLSGLGKTLNMLGELQELLKHA